MQMQCGSTSVKVLRVLLTTGGVQVVSQTRYLNNCQRQILLLSLLSMTVTLFPEVKVAKVEKLSLPLLLATSKEEGTLPD
eukprot:scaffold74545_cov56-Cyclotella_meneghiniana.AAC.3